MAAVRSEGAEATMFAGGTEEATVRSEGAEATMFAGGTEVAAVRSEGAEATQNGTIPPLGTLTALHSLNLMNCSLIGAILHLAALTAL